MRPGKGTILMSYNDVIGYRYRATQESGQWLVNASFCVVLDRTAPAGAMESRTTSIHVGQAKVYADIIVHPRLACVLQAFSPGEDDRPINDTIECLRAMSGKALNEREELYLQLMCEVHASEVVRDYARALRSCWRARTAPIGPDGEPHLHVPTVPPITKTINGRTYRSR